MLAKETKPLNELESFSIPRSLLATALALGTFLGCSENTYISPELETSGSTAVVGAENTTVNDYKNYNIEEYFFAIGTDMALMANGKQFGTIEQEAFTWGKEFTYTDQSGNKVASAKQKPFSWGVEINVYDANDKLIGVIEEKVWDSMFSITSKYSIKDPEGKLIAESEKLDFFGTTVEIKSPSKAVVARITRPAFNLGTDTWTVEKTGEIDSRLITFIASYKTASDNETKE